MKKFIILFFCLYTMQAFAQIERPVHWKFESSRAGDKKYAVTFTANIDSGWHIYSQFLKSGGPVPTLFKFNTSPALHLVDKVTEKPTAKSGFDKSFEMTISYHEKQVVFTQIVETKDPRAKLTGSITYMVCSGQKCLPPSDVDFDILLNGDPSQAVNRLATNAKITSLEHKNELSVHNTGGTSNSLMGIFIAGFLGGLAAFFLPCIYPMVPLTVSFFTKMSGSRSKGIRSAVIYGLSIIAIYVGLGLLITGFFGASALNEAASSAAFNLLFFAILIVLLFLSSVHSKLPCRHFWSTKLIRNQKAVAGSDYFSWLLPLH